MMGITPTIKSTTPVAVSMPSGVSFSAIANGFDHTCAVTTTGTAYCWGSNSNGALGDGTITRSATPVAVTKPNGVSFSAIATGGNNGGQNYTCALTTTGTAYCWGRNLFGQLGTCDNVVYNVPTLVCFAYGSASTSPWDDFTKITTGADHTCAIKSTGMAYCWGDNYFGQLGNGTTSSSPNNTPGAVTMPSGVTFSEITATDFFTCALSTTGTVYCWGANYSGNLGNGTTTASNVPVTITMPANVTFTAITVGAGHACALTTTRTAYCWGYNYHGQLGNGTTIEDPVGSTTPVAVTMPNGVSFTAISGSRNATCA
jgi:alpha-tubulin suppressor-like RCC1 family protein